MFMVVEVAEEEEEALWYCGKGSKEACGCVFVSIAPSEIH